MGGQFVPKAVYHHGCPAKHDCVQWDLILDLSHTVTRATTRPLRSASLSSQVGIRLMTLTKAAVWLSFQR